MKQVKESVTLQGAHASSASFLSDPTDERVNSVPHTTQTIINRAKVRVGTAIETKQELEFDVLAFKKWYIQMELSHEVLVKKQSQK